MDPATQAETGKRSLRLLLCVGSVANLRADFSFAPSDGLGRTKKRR